MEQQKVWFHNIPALVWGAPSTSVLLYIHGQGGNKEEAACLYDTICHTNDRANWRINRQILSIDLPGHGERASDADSFDPWHVVPEFICLWGDIQSRWEHISLFANSIGAWFSMLSFPQEHLDTCFFVSPVLDMKQLIQKMMQGAEVSETRLERERVIPTSFGQTLFWDYWQYVLAHPIIIWKPPTYILYGENDHLVDRGTVEEFAQRFGCTYTVVPGGEHWFHTESQLQAMRQWIGSLLSTE